MSHATTEPRSARDGGTGRFALPLNGNLKKVVAVAAVLGVGGSGWAYRLLGLDDPAAVEKAASMAAGEIAELKAKVDAQAEKRLVSIETALDDNTKAIGKLEKYMVANEANMWTLMRSVEIPPGKIARQKRGDDD